MGKVVNKIFNSSYMVHKRPERLQHENKYLLITFYEEEKFIPSSCFSEVWAS